MTESIEYRRLNPPERMLLGPDLSNASPRARQGLIAILQGATDPSFLKIIDEATALLRHLWATDNEATFLIPGSEETALEAAFVNMLEPGDVAVVGITGFFGERMAEVAERIGATVVRVTAEPRKSVDPQAIADALAEHKPKVLALLHGDGSTGIQQPLEGLADLAHEHEALLLVDSRWTISAVELNVDALNIDICIAGSQKAISAYPGLGLITFSPRAVEAYEQRKSPVLSWTLDLANLQRFRTDARAAQTMPAPIVYALTELLQLIYEQGNSYRIERMINRRDAVVAGLETLGLTIFADPAHRLSTVTVVNVPDGVDQDRVRSKLLSPFRIDIGGGLGTLQNKAWRVGIMGHSAQPTFLLSFITLLETILVEEGHSIPIQGQAGKVLLARLDP